MLKYDVGVLYIDDATSYDDGDYSTFYVNGKEVETDIFDVDEFVTRLINKGWDLISETEKLIRFKRLIQDEGN